MPVFVPTCVRMRERRSASFKKSGSSRVLAASRKIVSRSTSHEGRRKAYTYMSLAPEVKGRHMEALFVQLEQDPEEEISVHDGEEFIFVLDGTVKMKIGQDGFDLEPGDSVYYLSTTPHHISAKTGKATILAVLYEG